MLARVQVGSDPQESVLGVWTQAMVVKAPPRYGERFAPRLEWFGLLAVKKTWLMCPFKVTVRCVSALASSSGLRPTGVSSWSLCGRYSKKKYLISFVCNVQLFRC